MGRKLKFSFGLFTHDCDSRFLYQRIYVLGCWTPFLEILPWGTRCSFRDSKAFLTDPQVAP